MKNKNKILALIIARESSQIIIKRGRIKVLKPDKKSANSHKRSMINLVFSIFINYIVNKFNMEGMTNLIIID